MSGVASATSVGRRDSWEAGLTSQNDRSRSAPAEVTPRQAYEALHRDPRAFLLDVRSSAEWTFVGQPILSRDVLAVEWQSYPGMALNSAFVSQAARVIAAAGGDQGSPIYVICRSGGRSRAAASALMAAGYDAINVAQGFEGDLDPATGRRSSVNGWKQAGLPWRQS
jgi:rhodanese-related sulfurtransferase